MAANEYYQTHPDRYNTSFAEVPATGNYHHYNDADADPVMSGGISDSSSSNAHNARPHSGLPYQDASDVADAGPTYYGAGGGGRLQEGQGQYADNIPLTVKPQHHGRYDHMQYPPTPESQQHPEHKHGRSNRKGWLSGRIPWVVYTLSLVQIIVFIVEIAKYANLTGSIVETKPSFNPMIGPSSYLLINMGARFVPCMRYLKSLGDESQLTWPCSNSTSSDSSDASNQCSLQDLCGMTSFADNNPNQWYRFITPIFLHAGLLHIGFNLLLQMVMGREMEQLIGSLRFFLVYISAGIFGFVLGGNYAATGIASTGCSGSLFGILALTLLDLFYHWNERAQPVKELIFILIDVCVSFVLGLLPGLDNYSHIGGFLMGIVLGVCLLRSPNKIRQRTGMDDPPYTPVTGGQTGGRARDVNTFIKRPVGFFKGRKPAWWAWWLVRAAALITVLVAFIVLLNNFYKYRTTCSWCKYLSCLPVSNWCDIGTLTVSNSTSSKRNYLDPSLKSGIFNMSVSLDPFQ